MNTLGLVFLLISIMKISCKVIFPCPILKDKGPYLIPNPGQCDMFHLCVSGFINKTFLCSDGLIFNGNVCALPFGYNCGSRKKLQPPSPSGLCPRKNGKFSMESSCKKYVLCNEGIPKVLNCSHDLIFDSKLGECTWPSPSAHNRCPPPPVKCPPKKAGMHFELISHRKCSRFFYICGLPGTNPLLRGCPMGSLFDEKTKRCHIYVPECFH